MTVDWCRPQRAESEVMDYPWGETGPDAFIGRLTGDDNEAPKAELWMGAHPKAPSMVAGEGLDQWFSKRPELLGKESLSIYPEGLPYLFKVLSAAKPLSIQLHPNKKEAEELHARDPEHYPDDNHKPEIAIALEEHEALIGFDALEELLVLFELYPELTSLLDEVALSKLKNSLGENDNAKKELLKKAFNSLFKVAEDTPEKIKEAAIKLSERLSSKDKRTEKEDWFLKLASEGEETDAGLFCLFFLNYRVLQPGEGVFLKADVPHAYLRGNIIECMANSDNVVRAGLTPKFIDVKTLSRIVQVELEPLEVQRGESNGLGGEVFRVPVKEFEVHHWTSEGEEMSVNLAGLLGPRMVVVLRGTVAFREGETFSKGEVFFMSNLCSASMKLAKETEIYLARPGV